MKTLHIINNRVVSVSSYDASTVTHIPAAGEVVHEIDTDIPDVVGCEVTDKGTNDSVTLATTSGVTLVLVPVKTYKTKFTPPEFLLLFTSSERVAVRKLATTDDVVSDWFSIVNDPRLAEIDVTDTHVSDGLAYLVSKGVLTSERAALIEKGAVV